MKKQKVIPIKPELRKILDEFLNFEEYYQMFKSFAKIIGYHGNNMNRVRKVLFAPNAKGEIGFTISGMDELFLEFQLLRQLIDKEPYKTLLQEYPKAIQNIRRLSIKMLNKEDIGEEDLVMIFDTDQYDNSSEQV